jgi:hypothetical protein
MSHEAGSASSRKSEKSVRPLGWFALAIAVSSFLLIAPSASAAPAGGNGGNSDHRAFRVVDKNGNLVGYTVTENMVAREIDNIWVTFYVHPGFGIYDSGAIYLHYLTTDCSGTAYITHYSTFSEGTRVGAKLYYPKDQQQLTPRSVRVASPDGEGACYTVSDIAGVYGVAATVDVSSFGFELPFKAQ